MRFWMVSRFWSSTPGKKLFWSRSWDTERRSLKLWRNHRSYTLFLLLPSTPHPSWWEKNNRFLSNASGHTFGKELNLHLHDRSNDSKHILPLGLFFWLQFPFFARLLLPCLVSMCSLMIRMFWMLRKSLYQWRLSTYWKLP